MIATFLFHFVQFTTWPDSAFQDDDAPLTIGVIGTDPFGEAVDEVFRGETLGRRSFVVKRYPPNAVPEECHVLFVAGLDEARTERLMQAIRNRSVLTLSAQKDFCEAGGMVAFENDRGKVVFQIEREAVKRAGLSIHSRLLNMARPARVAQGG